MQGALEEALGRLTEEPTRVAGASRTDVGVHAKGQVVAFNTESRLTPERFLGGLNFHLPRNISVVKACEVAEGFDPRRWAIRRHYRYLLLESSVRLALWEKRAWQLNASLHLEAMVEAAQVLVGTRSVAPFTTASASATRDVVRTVEQVDVRRDGLVVCFDIVGKSFMAQQIRRSVGAMVQVGRGRATIEEFTRLALAGELGEARSLAPAHGLYLLRVEYPGGYPS